MLFPHAELVLEYRPVDEGFLRQWVAVLDNVASHTQEQGKHKEAEQMNRQALEGKEKVLGKSISRR